MIAFVPILGAEQNDLRSPHVLLPRIAVLASARKQSSAEGVDCANNDHSTVHFDLRARLPAGTLG
jgi:hypothetical protein